MCRNYPSVKTSSGAIVIGLPQERSTAGSGLSSSDYIFANSPELPIRDLRTFDSNRSFRFDSKVMGRFANFRIGRACPLLVVVKRLKPLTALSGTVDRLASSMSDHTPVLFNVFEDWNEEIWSSAHLFYSIRIRFECKRPICRSLLPMSTCLPTVLSVKKVWAWGEGQWIALSRRTAANFRRRRLRVGAQKFGVQPNILHF